MYDNLVKSEKLERLKTMLRRSYAAGDNKNDCLLVQINTQTLDNFLVQMETGYSKYSNPYHNMIHAADVTQTTHHVITRSGLSVGNTETAHVGLRRFADHPCFRT